jgi:ferrous iron transport protein A
MEQPFLSLNKLQAGKKGVIVNISAPEIEKRRFWDLGFVCGTIVQALHKSPGGDPVAYWIMGTVIALRNYDAEKIFIMNI